MLSDPVEAEKFLVELSNRRANLENNLNCLERNKEGEFLFSILEKLQGDELVFLYFDSPNKMWFIKLFTFPGAVWHVQK